MNDQQKGDEHSAGTYGGKPSWIVGCIREIESKLQKYKSRKKNETPQDRAARRTANATWWIAGFTLVSVAVGVSQAIIFNRQLTAMGGQLDEMRKAYTPLKDSADAAKAALIFGQRAWIRIDRISVGGGGMSISEDNISAPIAFVVTNIGNAPAIKLSHHVKLIAMATGVSVTDEQDKTCDEVKSQRWESGFTLFPNDQFPHAMGVGEYAYVTGLSKERITPALEASKDKRHLSLVVVGCIDYTFSTDPDTHHQTPFIRTISKNEPVLISIDDKLIPPSNLVLTEFGIGVGRPAN